MAEGNWIRRPLSSAGDPGVLDGIPNSSQIPQILRVPLILPAAASLPAPGTQNQSTSIRWLIFFLIFGQGAQNISQDASRCLQDATKMPSFFYQKFNHLSIYFFDFLLIWGPTWPPKPSQNPPQINKKSVLSPIFFLITFLIDFLFIYF